MGGRVGIAVLVVSLALARSSALSAQSASTPFQASDRLTLAELERAVRAGSPDLSAVTGELAVARAEARQARLFGNPSLDAAWSTIPLGRTNPTDLERPFANVPNYEVGVSYTFPLAKRAKRVRRADALVRAGGARLELEVRERALALADVLGGLATASLRRQGILDLIAGGGRAVELAEARLQAKFGTPLDVDQMEIDVERSRQLLLRVNSELSAELAACARLVGAPCEGFGDEAAARAYLTRWLAVEGSGRSPSERPDLRALAAYGDAARAELELAEAERWPDPTLRLGYVHDRFLVSGNHQNSLSLGLSVPLPMVDRGQFRQQAAQATRAALIEERARRLSVAHARTPALRTRLALARERCTKLGSEVIPKARAVLSDLEKAVESRLLPLMQVIQARRIVSELFIDEADSCGDAFAAALELIRETPVEGDAL